MLLALASVLTLSGPIDFSKVDRTPPRLPAVATPAYGLFLFGDRGETRVWAVIARSEEGLKRPDVLLVDLDADGDLTEPNERFRGVASESSVVFTVGDFTPPGSDVTHTDWKITDYGDFAMFSMNWRGEERTAGGYAPARKQYLGFSKRPEGAPVYVPGHDLPFQFERWMTDALRIGGTTDFKVFVGNRGSVTGAFSAMHQDFLPKDEYVLATLIYTDENGKQQRYASKLRERC